MLYCLETSSCNLPNFCAQISIGTSAKMGNAAVAVSPKQTAPESPANTGLATIGPEAETKPKKKICCACPDTKKLRDECIVEHGEEKCSKLIEAHKQCLRAEGFNV